MKTGVKKTNTKSKSSYSNNSKSSRNTNRPTNSNYNSRKKYNSKTTDSDNLTSPKKKRTTKSTRKKNTQDETKDLIISPRVTLINKNKHKKRCSVGFSWDNLFFPIITPLLRGDILNSMICVIVLSMLSEAPIELKILLWIIYSMFYNRIYINILLAKGYKPSNNADKKILKEKGII